MKVILLEQVQGVGDTGELKNVSDGFALNYLFPKNLATRATDEKINELKTLAEKLVKKEKEKQEKIKELAKKMKKIKTVKIEAKSGPKGKLFGSINKKSICEAILKSKKIDLSKQYVSMNEEIKSLGKYKVQISIPEEKEFEISVEVVETG
tara:strand:- start:11412 stop:11864 length:453 start_codon:yes stop_codon:yes gene_type:complete